MLLGGGLRLRHEGRDGRHAVRQARQLAEQLDQSRVGALRDVAVGAHQTGRVVVEELWVGPEKPREVGEAPFESGRRDDAVQQRPDAFHLAQAERVNLVGRERGGGELPDAIGIPRRAVGQLPHPDRLPCLRDVAAHEVVIQLAIGRCHALRVCVARRPCEPFALARRDRRGKLRERLEQRARHRVVGRDPTDLVGHIAQRHAWRRDPGLESLPEQHDGLVDQRRNAVQALVDQAIVLLGKGLETGITPPRVTLRDVPDQIRGITPDDPMASPLLQPFAQFPPAIPASERERLTRAARDAYTQRVAPAYRKLYDYFVGSYVPKTRESIGMRELPDGAAWDAYRVRQFTTTTLSPDQIHALGLREVKRIRALMDSVIASTGFKGSFADFARCLT